VANYDLYPTPPAEKIDQNPLTKRRCHAIPGPFQPPPPRTLVDCGVAEVCDRAVRSISPARSQIATSILPHPAKKFDRNPLTEQRCHAIPRPFQPSPPCTLVGCGVFDVATGQCGQIRPHGRKLQPLSYPPPKKLTKIFSQNEDATPSPGCSSPRPRVRSLIVVSLRSATGRCGLIRPPGGKLRPLSYPPQPKKMTKIFSQNEDATPSPVRSSPHPRVRSVIVVSLRLVNRRCGLILPHSCKLSPLSYPPPPKNSTKIPF